MFEKEAEEWVMNNSKNIINKVSNGETNLFGIAEQAFQEGAKFGYNKANEWHYMKDAKCDEDLPQNKKVYYAYIVNLGTYDNPIIQPKLGSFSVIEFDIMAYCVIAWKEIILPEFKRRLNK